MATLFPDLARKSESERYWALAQGASISLAELRHSRLTPLIFEQLMHQAPEGGMDPLLLKKLKEDYASSLMASALQEQDVIRVIQALNESKVESILLKGADLRLRLYRDPAQRPMGDLDLLICQAQLPKARDALAGLGYIISPWCADPRPGFRELFTNYLIFEPTPNRTLPVDLQWEIRAVYGFYRLPNQALQAKAVSANYHGVPVKLLAPEHALLHLSLHAFDHFYVEGRMYFETLQLIDIVLALTHLSVSWPEFLQEVIRFRCQRPVYLTLLELARILPFAVPAHVLANLGSYRPSRVERMMLSYRFGYLSSYFPVFYHHPIREWFRFLGAKFKPSSSYLSTLPSKSSRFRYLRQFLRKLSSP